ncbi:hypothetical protein BVRB_9g222360 isoform B [Beta vulgaris subsp. vulgaris]|nr:hypothetical protein BVRB_9g222360 isoform B [Beta vulgaris subsp. vulgaris]
MMRNLFLLIYVFLELLQRRKNDELRKDAVDALCCLDHALGQDFAIFIPSIHKLLLKHRLRHKEFEEVEGRDGCDMLRDVKSHQVNDGRLRSTKDDWAEWMRHFSIELLKESPSPALRTCARLTQLQPFVKRELFAAGFVSCWAQLNVTSQRQLVRQLETTFSSPNIPPEILSTLLNLV